MKTVGVAFRLCLLSALGLLAGCGSDRGAPSVPVAPGITVHPADRTVVAGQTATFSVTATGTSLAYAWQRSTSAGGSFSALPGETGASLTRAVALADSGHRFRVVVSNAAGSVMSSAALLTVTEAPVFTTQPADATIVEGETARFEVAAIGDPTPTLHWELSTDGGTTWTGVAGATAATLDVADATTTLSGRRFRAVATNAGGTATSHPALLTVTPAPGPLATVVFSRADGSVANLHDLWVIREDGGGEVQLTSTPEAEVFSAVTPGGRIVFQRASGGQTDLFGVNADATGLATLADSGDSEVFQALTPGGRVIFRRDAAATGRDLWSVNADGTDPVALASTIDHEDFVALSPAGRVIYQVNVGGLQAEVLTVAADGTARAALLSSPSDELFQGVTPAGEVLVARCNVGFCTWLIVPDTGGAPRLLADDTFAGEYALGGITSGGVIVLKRNMGGNLHHLYAGGTVALAGSNDDETYVGSTPAGRVIFQRTTGGQLDLWAVNADGSDPTALATTAADEVFAGVSADGRVLYARGAAGGRDLHVVRADGTGGVPLATAAADEELRAVTGGGRVIYERNDGVTNGLRAVSLDGSGDVALADGSAFYVGSTPGGRVLFRTQGGNEDLYVVGADGTGLTPLAASPNDEFFTGLVP